MVNGMGVTELEAQEAIRRAEHAVNDALRAVYSVGYGSEVRESLEEARRLVAWVVRVVEGKV